MGQLGHVVRVVDPDRMVVVIGSTVRAELLKMVNVDERWPVVDQFAVDEIHPPCAVLLREFSRTRSAFSTTSMRFTLRLVVGLTDASEHAARLLDTLGDGAYLDALNAAAAVPNLAWDSVIVDESERINAVEEVMGQALVMVADIPLEVYG